MAAPTLPSPAQNEAAAIQANRFQAPTGRTLSALVGLLEIPVAVPQYANFSEKISGQQMLAGETANDSPETSLNEAIGAGRSFSREALAADARTEQARAQSGQARAALLPSLYVRASTGQETSSPASRYDNSGLRVKKDTHHREDTTWTLRQAVFDLPSFLDLRRRNVITQARDASRAAADGDAYLSSTSAYLSLVSTRLQANMARDFERQLGELLVYVEKRASAGASSSADMARVKARSQAAISSRLEQEAAHAAASVEFVRLTNLAPQTVRLPELEDLGVSAMPDNLDDAIRRAMDSNPDIAALLSETRAAEIDRSAARSRFLPRLDVELTDSKSLHAQGDPSNDGQRDKRIMLVMNWRILDGGSDIYYGRERAARHVELKYRLDDQRRLVVQSLSAHYATLRSTRERLNTGYGELNAIASAAEAMSRRMLSGNQSLLDLLDTYDRHYQARVRLVNLHILEMNSVANIIRLTQGAPRADGGVADKSSPAVAASPRTEVSVTQTSVTPAPGHVPTANDNARLVIDAALLQKNTANTGSTASALKED